MTETQQTKALVGEVAITFLGDTSRFDLLFDAPYDRYYRFDYEVTRFTDGIKKEDDPELTLGRVRRWEAEIILAKLATFSARQPSMVLRFCLTGNTRANNKREDRNPQQGWKVEYHGDVPVYFGLSVDFDWGTEKEVRFEYENDLTGDVEPVEVRFKFPKPVDHDDRVQKILERLDGHEDIIFDII